MKLPQFKNTEEALAFGEKYAGNPGIIRALRTRKEMHDQMVKDLRHLAREEAICSQLYREALEVAEGGTK